MDKLLSLPKPTDAGKQEALQNLKEDAAKVARIAAGISGLVKKVKERADRRKPKDDSIIEIRGIDVKEVPVEEPGVEVSQKPAESNAVEQPTPTAVQENLFARKVTEFGPEVDEEVQATVNTQVVSPAPAPANVNADNAGVESEQESKEEKPKGRGRGLKNFFSNKWVLIAGAVLIVTVIIIVAAGFLQGNAGPQRTTAPVIPQPQPVVTNVPNSTPPKPSLWANIKNLPTSDRSPWGKGYIDANGVAAVIFVIFLVIWVILDWRARIKTHQGVGRFAIESMLLGFLLVPLINLTATWSLIWGLLVLVTMAFLINAPIHSVTAHKDKTHLSTVFALVAFCLYLAGHFDLPIFLGRLVDMNWHSWQGVYGIGGLFILAIGLHFTTIILTMIIIILVFLAIWTGASEAGKRLGPGAYTLGIGMIIFWILSYWLLGLAENWLIVQMGAITTAIAALDIARPIISWLISILIAFVLGLALGDQSLVIQERKIGLGLQDEKRSISSVADFVSYATIIALAWMILA